MLCVPKKEGCKLSSSIQSAFSSWTYKTKHHHFLYLFLWFLKVKKLTFHSGLMFFLSQKQSCKVHFRYVFFRLLFVRQNKYQQLKDGQFVFCIYFFEQNVEIFPRGEFFFNFLCFQLSISSVNATKPGQIWSHLLIKSLMKNLIFCAMFCHCMTILVIFFHFQNFNYYSSIIIVRFVV